MKVLKGLSFIMIGVFILVGTASSNENGEKNEFLSLNSIDKDLNMKLAPSDFPNIDEDIIKNFSIPERASIYGSIDGLTLISSKKEFKEYLNFDTSTPQYNDEYRKKSSYKKIMELISDYKIDFNEFYLFIVARTENSGSIEVSMSDPVWENKETIKLILSSKSDFGINHTNDMAYYGYAYRINKSIKYLKINDNKITLADGIPESKLSDEEKAFNILMGGFGY